MVPVAILRLVGGDEDERIIATTPSGAMEGTIRDAAGDQYVVFRNTSFNSMATTEYEQRLRWDITRSLTGLYFADAWQNSYLTPHHHYIDVQLPAGSNNVYDLSPGRNIPER